MTPNNKKVPCQHGEVIINNDKQSKEGIIKTLEQWMRKAFIIRNNEIYLPNDTTTPVHLKDAPNSSVEFRAKRDTGASSLASASEYLINTSFDTGFQAGHETAKNEMILEGFKITAPVAKEYAKKINDEILCDLDPESRKKVIKYLSELQDEK